MRFHELTAPQLRACDKENTLVVAPIAAVEQHGPHLPTGTDMILCGSVAEAVEQRLPERVLLLPTQWLGASQHHLRWGATLTATLETYTTLLCELLTPLLDQEHRRVLLLNGHGGNVDPMKAALRRLQLQHQDKLLGAACYWDIGAAAIATAAQGEFKGVGHACEVETAMVMHLRPELVRTDELRNASDFGPDSVDGVYLCRDMAQRTAEGATGRPDLATPETGAKMFAGIVDAVAAACEMLCQQPLPEPRGA